jgi:hypothetical protein
VCNLLVRSFCAYKDSISCIGRGICDFFVFGFIWQATEWALTGSELPCPNPLE